MSVPKTVPSVQEESAEEDDPFDKKTSRKYDINDAKYVTYKKSLSSLPNIKNLCQVYG